MVPHRQHGILLTALLTIVAIVVVSYVRVQYINCCIFRKDLETIEEIDVLYYAVLYCTILYCIVVIAKQEDLDVLILYYGRVDVC